MEIKNRFNISQVKNFWDSIAEKYDEENKKIAEVHLQRFVKSLNWLKINDNSRILNVWSRTGTAIKYLRRRNQNFSLYNLEVSPKLMARAKIKFPEENFALTDLCNFNFADNFFDEVLSLETIEHCPRPKQFLQEINRVLKTGGRLIMSSPPAICEPIYALYNFCGFGHGEGPHRFLSPKTVKKLLREAGFQLKEHKGTILVPLGPKIIRKIGEKIINKFQNTFIKELGIRQFYVSTKKSNSNL